jgi:DNA-binding transcriptional MerR regulator
VTSPPLLTIGAFARAVGLTPSALRHYDETGLLVPAEVDDATGYRYYTPDLVHRARLIVALREAGVPIASMRRILDSHPSDARRVLTGLLDERAADAARAQSALREVLTTLDAAPPDAPGTGEVDGPALAAALRQVSVAADTDPDSPLGTVLVDLENGSLDVVATNRYWMLVRTLGVASAAGAGRVVLASSVVGSLADTLDNAGRVTLELSEGRLRVAEDGGAVVAGRDVGYPAHRLIVAGLEPPVARVVLPVEELHDAVTAAHRAEVDVELGPDDVRVSAADADPAVHVKGRGLGTATVRLGSALLTRALASLVGPEVTLEVVADDRPVVLRSAYQPGFVALVMPVRRS